MFRTILLTGLILLLSAVTLSAQERDSIIVLSPKIGEIIDRQERDLYGLFPASQNFQSAVIYQVSDSSYVAEITERHEDRLRIRRLNIDQKEMDVLRSQLGIFILSGASFQAKENPILVILDNQYREWEGKLLGCHADSVLLGDPHSLSELKPKRIHIDEIRSISLRRQANMTGGCAGGLLIGAAIGAIIGTAAAGSEESFFPMGRETYILFYAIPLSILGGCVGGTGKALEGKDQHSDLTQMSYRQKIDLLIRLSGL